MTATAHAPPKARVVAATEYRQVGDCLGRAFHDDPLAEFFFPDSATRPQRFSAFACFVMQMLSPHCRYVTCDPIHGAALWQAPSPPKLRLLDGVVAGTWLTVVIHPGAIAEIYGDDATPAANGHARVQVLDLREQGQGQAVTLSPSPNAAMQVDLKGPRTLVTSRPG